jgi:hypothetical protein
MRKREENGRYISGESIKDFKLFTEKEKYEYAISKGFTYDEATGDVKSPIGMIIKNKDTQGYSNMQIYENRSNKFSLKGHRFAWYYIHKEIPNIIDHINGVRDDNRIINLRNVTQQQNMFNTNAKGCYYDKHNKKWQSVLRVNGKKIASYHNTEDEAHQAYLDKKKIYHDI